MLIVDDDCTLDEAEDAIEFDDEEAKTVRYDKSRKGFYVVHRTYDFDTIRLLAESVYSARFVDDMQMAQLIDVICSLVSDYQAEKLTTSGCAFRPPAERFCRSS